MTGKQIIASAYFDVRTAKLFLADAQRMLEKFNLSELPGESLTNALQETKEAEAFLRESMEQS